MKNMKKSTWIAILCVLLAIAASQIYGTLGTERAERETVTMVSEVKETVVPAPTPTLAPTPVPTPTLPPVTRSVAADNAPADTQPQKAPLSFSLPSSGEAKTPYSETELIYFAPIREWRAHLGIDFLPAETDMVFAAAPGIVERIYEDHLYGTTVVLAHASGYKTYYSSLSEVHVAEGDEITEGHELGLMGQTAPAEEGVHLHFAMEKDGKLKNPFAH